MTEHTFRLYDASIHIGSSTAGEMTRPMGDDRVDWETFNRVQHVLEGVGFEFGPDPEISKRYASIAKYHRRGWRETPGGRLWVKSHVFPVGMAFEFYQEVVTVNRNGGEYDFDKRAKMPYLIGKAFELAVVKVRAELVESGFAETTSIASPNPDPLAWFNSKWDGEYERRRGTHRFRRDDSGWPAADEIAKQCWGVTAGRPLIQHGALRYFRDWSGRLMRGRCYGGINGMWLVVYGPGPRDHTHLHCAELFECNPSQVARRMHPRSVKRLAAELAQAVAAQDFERAIVLRDVIARDAGGEQEGGGMTSIDSSFAVASASILMRGHHDY